MDSKQAKKNRAAGKRFEDRVRNDLESKGWIVDRWTNNVELQKENSVEVSSIPDIDGGFTYGKLVKAKPRQFKGRIINMWTGFPDFIAFKCRSTALRESFECWEKNPLSNELLYENIGVECKSGGPTNKYLDKEEKAKCKLYLEDNIFSKILIANKGKKRGEIIYKEFEE